MHSRNESGAALMLALALTVVLATLVFQFSITQQSRGELRKARAAGWHLTQIAKAARLFVRNNSLSDPLDNNGDGIADNTFSVAALNGPSPIELTVNDLINAGLLPAGFNPVNALGQNIRIIAANDPIDCLCDESVPSAYILLENSGPSSPKLMQYVASEAAKLGLNITAPIFDGTVNISNDCDGDGNSDVALWDTGCLDLDEYQMLVSDPTAIFEPGSLLAPAWRSVQHDPRAVMRYAQPENHASATMMTDLKLGAEQLDASGNCAAEVEHYIMENDGTFTAVSSGFCEVAPDDSSNPDWREADQRVDIVNAGSVSTGHLFLVPQEASVETSFEYDGTGGVSAVPEPHSMLSTKATEALHVAGTLYSGNGSILLSGRLPNPTGSPGDPGYMPQLGFTRPDGTQGDLFMFRNIVVGSPGADTPGLEVTGTLTISNVSFEDLASTDTINISGTLNADTITTGDLDISGTGNLGQMNATDILSASQATFTNPVTVDTITASDIATTDASSITLNTDTVTTIDASLYDVDSTDTLDIDNCTGIACPDILP